MPHQLHPYFGRVAARLSQKGFTSVRGTHLYFAFFLQIAAFSSGAEGIRTPDLRRAKSDPQCRACSSLFKNTCKIALLHLAAFASIRCCSCGLVYYWCKRVLACCTTGRSPVAIVPRSRWATCYHEPRRVQRPRARGDGHTRVAREVLDWHRARRRPDLGLGLRAVRRQRPLRAPQGSVRSANAERGGTPTTSRHVGLCTKAWSTVGEPILGSRFSCKTHVSRSGAEGNRTPDLRR